MGVGVGDLPERFVICVRSTKQGRGDSAPGRNNTCDRRRGSGCGRKPCLKDSWRSPDRQGEWSPFGGFGRDKCLFKRRNASSKKCIRDAACGRKGYSAWASECWWRTSEPRTQKMTSSAMLVAWSAERSRLRETMMALSAWALMSGRRCMSSTSSA